MSTITTHEPSAWRQRLEVARWEFQRFVKPKQLLFSLLFTLVAGGVGYFMAKMAERSAQVEVEVAVVGGEALALPALSDSVVTFRAIPAAARDSAIEAVTAQELDAVLEVTGPETATLHVRRERPWRHEVTARVAAARQGARLRESGMRPEQLAALMAPGTVDLRVTDTERGGRAARLTAAMATFAVLYGVFMAMALMLVSVTAEKQLRVTEQLISTLRPQDWIDGKILGIAAASAINILLFGLSALIFFVGRAIATGRWNAPQAVSDPLVLGLILLFALLGFAFWLAFFGAVAATIDDPNTSTRGPLMFLPAVFQAGGFMILSNPDSTFARVLGIIPLTSSGVMPVRLASTDVPWWEVLLSLALLVGGVLLLRRAAGRVFALGMLMTGKEPTWGEVRRWVREAS